MEDEGLIARNVRRRMEAKGFNSKRLSLEARLNETYVRDILKGKSRNPRQAHLQKLALALECRVSDLTGEPKTPDGADSATTPFEREILAGLRVIDEHGLELVARLVRSLTQEAMAAPDPPPQTPSGPHHPHGTRQ